MAKDRQFWFRVKVTDESSTFERIDVEAEGLFSKMRRDAFKGDPRGFMVDHKGFPIPVEEMADNYRMTNGRLKARMSELHDRGIIQTVDEFGAALRTLKSAWASRKVSAFVELSAKVKGAPGDVYVIPPLLDDVLDALVGSRTGKEGWEEDENGNRRRRSKSETPSATPIRPPQEGAAERPGHLLHSQSQSQSEQSELESPSSPSRERESSTAHARGDQNERPMPWSVYTARCHEVSVWQKRQPEKQSPEAFEANFEAEFQFTWATWCEIKRAMESAIPAPCRDGHHVFDGGSSCSYCPFVRVGETA
jgi:hypothetical protein